MPSCTIGLIGSWYHGFSIVTGSIVNFDWFHYWFQFNSTPSHTTVLEKSTYETETLNMADETASPTTTSPTTSMLPDPQHSRLSCLFHKDKYTVNVKTSIHKCHLCNYKTTNRSSLRSHYAVHSTDRPYACDLCMYEAKRLNDLRKHKLVKHGKRMPLMMRKGRRKCSSGNGMLPPSSLAPSLIPMLPEHSMYPGIQDTPTGTTGAVSLADITDAPSTGLIPNTSVFPEPELQNTIAGRQNASDGDAVVVKSELDNYSLYHASSDDQMNSNGDRFSRNSDTFLHEINYNSLDVAMQQEEEQHHPTSSPARMSALLNRKDVPLQTPHSSCVLTPTDLYGNSHNNYHATTSPYATNRSHTGRDSSDGRSMTDESSHHGSLNNHPVSVTMHTRMRSVGTDTRKGWHCKHCDILFFDSAIYFMHMGLHSPHNAWQCNLCSEVLTEVYSFTSHFINEHVNTKNVYSGDINT